MTAIVGAVWWFVGAGPTGPMLVLAGAGVFVVGGLLLMDRDPLLRLLTIVGFGMLVGGLEAFVFTPTRLVGSLVGAAGLALFLFAAALYTRPGRADGTQRGLVPGTMLIVVCLAVPLGILGLGSRTVHDSGAYVRQHGTIATVRLPDRCASTRTFGGTPSGVRNVACPGATWSVGGRQVTGTLQGRAKELSTPGPFRGVDVGWHVETFEAYVFADEAFTSGASRDVGPVVALGHLSPWFAVALPGALVLWFVMRRFRWWRGRSRAGGAVPLR